MSPDDALLLAAVAAAPRRYALPPLPATPEAAADAGVEASLAFAIEAARRAKAAGTAAAPEVQDLFTSALAAFIAEALAPTGGDPAFQALVLQAQEPQLRSYVRLAAEAAADRRSVRALTDALAHPGKTRQLPAGALREALAELHELASSAAWGALRVAAAQLLQSTQDDAPRAAGLQALLALPALQRLEQLAHLHDAPSVLRYRALCAQRGPQAGSQAAAAQGRSAARLGEVAEHATVAAFEHIAGLLQPHAASALRVARGLRTPRGFPAAGVKTKDEWDVVIVRAGAAGAELALLAEVKASPAAATPDLARLRRGLLRLAQAQPHAQYLFPCANGELAIAGASLQRLRPPAEGLPAHVIYCSTAAPETQPPWLAAASKAVLAAEPASIAFALRLLQGAAPPHQELAPVWQALGAAPRLRATLHQHESAQAVRQAMLHPDDLLAAVRALLARGSAA